MQPISPLWLALLPCTFTANLLAQGVSWVQLASPVNPPPRYWSAMAYDAARSEVVLFGAANGCSNDTWTWNGVTWTPRSPTTSPPARNMHALSYDRVHDVVVLFGGNNCGAYLNDTWTWNGTDWQAQQPAHQPPPRASFGFTYHAASQVCLLYGGWNGTRLNDTWEWNGVDWTQRQPQTTPGTTRHYPSGAMVYDELRERTVLCTFYPSTNIETWEWDANNWQLRAVGPALPDGCQLGYDQVRGRTILLGGDNGYTTVFNYTYEWDGTIWTVLNPLATIHRSLHSMVFDEARDQLLTFGGLSALFPSPILPTTAYVYSSRNPARWNRYGTACPGALGDLELIGRQRAWLGDNCAIELRNLPTGSLAFLVTGQTQTQLTLAGLGMPGCTQLVVTQNVYSLPVNGNKATWSLAVPNTTALAGVNFVLQGAALQAGGSNPPGAAFSAGLQGRIGRR